MCFNTKSSMPQGIERENLIWNNNCDGLNCKIDTLERLTEESSSIRVPGPHTKQSSSLTNSVTLVWRPSCPL